MATTRSSVAVAFAAAFLVACGGGGGGGGSPDAVRVSGTLTNSGACTVQGQVSFALQWLGADYPDGFVNLAGSDGVLDPGLVSTCEVLAPVVYASCDGTPTSGHEVCQLTDMLATTLLQAVRYDAQFPISFAVPVEGDPPPEALYDLARQGGSGVFAMATVLAFVDEDGDGLLRLGTQGVAPEQGLANSAYQDYVPADGSPRRSYFVTYLDGTIAPAAISPSFAEVLLYLPQGYAIWLKEESVDPWGRRIAVHRSAQPIDTPVDLVARPGVEDAALWCSAFEVERTYVSEIPAGEVPAMCWDGGLSAQWSRTTTVAPCRYREEVYEASFACGGTAPAWSCPGT